MWEIFHNPAKFILVVLSFILVGCSGYTKRAGKVYQRHSNEAHLGVSYVELEEADYKTFRRIKHNPNIYLGKDKQYIFYDSSILKEADPNTFEHIKEYYWKDEKNVYLLRFGITEYQIKDADPQTFFVLDDNLWAKDKNKVYYGFKKLYSVNKDKFTPINEDWGKDDIAYYWQDLRVDSLDYNTAKILSPYYIRDIHHVFFQNKIVDGADASTFNPDGIGSFGHDKLNMFSGTKNNGPITDHYRDTYINKKSFTRNLVEFLFPRWF